MDTNANTEGTAKKMGNQGNRRDSKNYVANWCRKEKRKRIYTRDNNTCVYCGASIYDDTNVILTLDHVVAKELGGTNEATNLVTACKSCNSAKQALTLRGFLRHLTKRGHNTAGVARAVRRAIKRQLPK